MKLINDFLNGFFSNYEKQNLIETLIKLIPMTIREDYNGEIDENIVLEKYFKLEDGRNFVSECSIEKTLMIFISGETRHLLITERDTNETQLIEMEDNSLLIIDEEEYSSYALLKESGISKVSHLFVFS